MKKTFVLGLLILLLVQCNMKKQVSKIPVEAYSGTDLGLTFQQELIQFKVYSPKAEKVLFNIYQDNESEEPIYMLNLAKQNDIWVTRFSNEYQQLYYTIKVFYEGKWLSETVDPYVKMTSANGKRGFIGNPNKFSPPNWKDEKFAEIPSRDAIIYELHVRDFSVAQNSGMQQKGKFLAFTETDTKNYFGAETGLSHIKNLGVTHIHLLPFFDYASIDETQSLDDQYNWGYDPQNYNTPEGSYITDPTKPEARVVELKQAIQAIHKQGLGVVMDVVYNHTFNTENSSFENTYPGYYFRKNADSTLSNASGCGNETASDQVMFQKFMIESLKFWAKEYKIDGFRFDLMGIHDIKTMNKIAAELKNINPYVLLYGEGWTAGGSPLPDSLRALKKNTFKLNDVAAFSDDMRDGIKGSVFEATSPGLVNGGKGKEESVKFGIVGNINHPQIDFKKVDYSDSAWAAEPFQSINYVSCHDNLTLYDKLKETNPTTSEEEILAMQKLALGIVLTSQGIPFLHAGSEFLRSKNGVENSYKSPDKINQIDWDLISKNEELVKDIQKLIEIRKQHKYFAFESAEQVRAGLKFLNTPQNNVIAYELNGNLVDDTSSKIVVIINAQRRAIKFPIDFLNLKPIYGDPKIGKTDATIPKTSMVIFAN